MSVFLPKRGLTPILVLFLACSATASAEPRTAQVAGAFYPADPAELRATVAELLDRHPAPDPGSDKPRVLILPHAGYEYSGPVAARGFREVQGRRYDAAVIVAFTHRDEFEGTSVDDREAYQTPLGTIPVDRDAVAFLLTQPRVHHLERAHAGSEHSLEVMLPFLQVALGEVPIVPLLMGRHDGINATALADALAGLAARGEYLFVFSTDLSHYHPYDDARQRDLQTVKILLTETPLAVARWFQVQAEDPPACGWGPIRAGLALSERLGYLERRLLAYANSGDTTGEKSRVVGYAAIGLYERPPVADSDRLSEEAGQALVQAARQAIAAHLRPSAAGPPVTLERFPELGQPRGMFVTLRKGGQLRGCMGRIHEREAPMRQLISAVALDAALHDPRFPLLAANELDEIALEVSVLTVPQPVSHVGQIVPGRDGVVLQLNEAGGVFLPQVWDETGFSLREFLEELASEKAGLPRDAWQRAQLYTFQAQVFEEESSGVEAGASPH